MSIAPTPPLWLVLPSTPCDNSKSNRPDEYIDVCDAINFVYHQSSTLSLIGGPPRNAYGIASCIREQRLTIDDPFFEDGTDSIDPIWRGLRKLHPDLPENAYTHDGTTVHFTLLHTTFFDQVFSPLIPDSPILNRVMLRQENHGFTAKLLHVISVILLIIEVPLRSIASLFITLALHIYALKNRDTAEYYRFRLHMNMARSSAVAFKSVFGLGGY